jgi:RimJ/RimL family protein N-acetyltransferase
MLTIGKHVVDWVSKQTNEFGNFGTEIGIGWIRGELIAGVAYSDWNGPNIVCHIASDRSKRWLTRQFLWTIFDYPFNQIGVKRITVCIGQGNKDSVRFVKHLGFELETTLKSAHPTGDLLVLVMWKESCKWISQDFAKPYAKAA